MDRELGKTMTARIFISEDMDASAVADLAREFEVDYRPALVDDVPGLCQALSRADGWIVRNRTQVRGRALEAAARLRVVGRLGVGLDNIDVAACKSRGIRVIPAIGANAESVAEYVVAMALVLLRGAAYRSTSAVLAGRWPRQMLSQGREVAGKTLGLLGFGSIGQVTARKAHALGMKVIASDPAVPPDAPAWREAGTQSRPFDALLAESDAVSLHLPLTDGTRGLLGAAQFARMKRGAVLINSARGGVVDEAALARALHEGRIAAAALDVFDEEPLKAGSVLVEAPNLLLTPHIAGVTVESNERVSSLVAARVAEVLRA